MGRKFGAVLACWCGLWVGSKRKYRPVRSMSPEEWNVVITNSIATILKVLNRNWNHEILLPEEELGC